MSKRDISIQFQDESNTFDTIVEALDGDFLTAFRLCEYLSGLVIRIPSKMHKMKIARILIELECSQSDVMTSTGISRASYYNLTRSYREECRCDDPLDLPVTKRKGEPPNGNGEPHGGRS